MTGKRGRTLAERFWEKVDVRGPDECWPWKAGIGSHGYGGIRVDGETRTSHTVAYELQHGPIPEEYDEAGKRIEVCHSCHFRPCCNGAHLSLGTRAQNAQQMSDAGRSNQTKGYTEEQMKIAVLRVKSGQSIRSVARSLGINRNALANNLPG